MSRKINVLQVGLGFIGGRYKEVLDDRVDKYSIKRLESGVTPLFESPSNESITLSQLPNKIQALVVFAYSEKRKENFDILHNVFSLATELCVETVIYIGTSAIFDIKDGVTNEQSPHLIYREFYADTKLKIRNVLKKKACSFDGSVIVLHPTIVFGPGGNWSRTIRNSLKCGTVLLPKGGSGLCNPIHVDDVCQAVDLAVMRPSGVKFSEYIISSGVTVPWRKIYEWKQSFDISGNIKTGRITNCEHAHLFNNRWIKNVVYHFLYSRLGALLGRIIKRATYKKIISPKKDLLQEYQSSNVYEPTGIYRLLHVKKQVFSIESAKDELNFNPKFSSEDAIMESLRD